MQAMREGWEFMTAPANRDVACLGAIKASGSLCWGITDLLNVKYVVLCVGWALNSEAVIRVGCGMCGCECVCTPSASMVAPP